MAHSNPAHARPHTWFLLIHLLKRQGSRSWCSIVLRPVADPFPLDWLPQVSSDAHSQQVAAERQELSQLELRLAERAADLEARESAMAAAGAEVGARTSAQATVVHSETAVQRQVSGKAATRVLIIFANFSSLT